MTAHDPETGTLYESVAFQGDMVQVSYTEERDRGDGVARISTLVVDSRRVPNEYAEFMDALRALVDAGNLALRNPPERIR